jgi:hypothetical protein
MTVGNVLAGLLGLVLMTIGAVAHLLRRRINAWLNDPCD